MKKTIKLGISACLLGSKVRFDGGHKWDRFITDTLGKYVEYRPVCPEAECGLGIPREPMRLAGEPDSPRLTTVHTGEDHMGCLKNQLSPEERKELLEVINSYRQGRVPMIVPITLLNHYVHRYDLPYLREQYYLYPHPIELQLRNHV